MIAMLNLQAFYQMYFLKKKEENLTHAFGMFSIKSAFVKNDYAVPLDGCKLISELNSFSLINHIFMERPVAARNNCMSRVKQCTLFLRHHI